MMRLPVVALIAVVVTTGACAPGDPPSGAEKSAPSVRDEPRATTPATPPAAPPASNAPRIVILGDSLTAGYGLDKAQAFPSLLQAHLDAEGYKYEVINAGVSGDTTAGGLRRFEWATEGNVRVLVVALGGNDGLRGLPASETRKNLAEIITRARKRGIRVILAGMEAPPNYGEHYTAEFRDVFRNLAKEHDVPFVPFLLEGVAGIPALNISDGIHPNPQGARIVERNIWTALEPVLDALPSR